MATTTNKRRRIASEVNASPTPKLPGVLMIERYGKAARYVVTETQHPAGRVFHLTEIGGTKTYKVFVGGAGNCSCEAGRRFIWCKHRSAVQSAIQAGDL